jgi:hypothetical protein
MVVLLLAFDFWTVKNVSGRLLVGLRWWNEVREDGTNEWRFESREDTSRISDLDSRVFWLTLWVMPLVWGIFTVSTFFSFNYGWMLCCLVLPPPFTPRSLLSSPRWHISPTVRSAQIREEISIISFPSLCAPALLLLDSLSPLSRPPPYLTGGLVVIGGKPLWIHQVQQRGKGADGRSCIVNCIHNVLAAALTLHRRHRCARRWRGRLRWCAHRGWCQQCVELVDIYLCPFGHNVPVHEAQRQQVEGVSTCQECVGRISFVTPWGGFEVLSCIHTSQDWFCQGGGERGYL